MKSNSIFLELYQFIKSLLRGLCFLTEACLFMVVSVFVSLDAERIWNFTGLVLAAAGFFAHIAAKIAFGNTESSQAVTGGMYTVSRNPMYASLCLVFLGTAVASQSIILAVLWVLMAAATHALIRGEERYCIETYGDSFREYMKKTPRYLLYF